MVRLFTDFTLIMKEEIEVKIYFEFAMSYRATETRQHLGPISPTIFKCKLDLSALSVSFIRNRTNETDRALNFNFHLNIVGEIGP